MSTKKYVPVFKSPAIVLLMILAFLVTACGGAQSTAVDDAATPSNAVEVEQPTATPTPANTATAEPTATPNTVATAAAQSTQAADGVLSELDQFLSDTDVPYKDGHLLWKQNEPIVINMQGPSGNDDIETAIDKNLTGGNFVFKSDVTWQATGWMYCGAIFRSEPDIDLGKQYQFYFLRFSGLPVWYIEVWESKNYLGTVSKEQSSNNLNMENGATNQFVLVAQDEIFTVYFNGIRQGRYVDSSKQLTKGYFGFFGWQESGTGSCTYENSWIWSLDQ